MIFNFPSIPLLSICLLDSVKSSDDDLMTRIAKKTLTSYTSPLLYGPGKEGAGGFVEENMQPLVWFSLSHFIYTVRKLLTDFAPTVGYG